MSRILFRGKGKPRNLFRFIHFLPQFIKLYWRLFCDGRVRLFPKIMLAAALVYFLSPLDLVPEIINPLLGISDDLAVVFLALGYFIKMVPKNVVEEHIRRIESEL